MYDLRQHSQVYAFHFRDILGIALYSWCVFPFQSCDINAFFLKGHNEIKRERLLVFNQKDSEGDEGVACHASSPFM